jgi:hypothetical protein
LDGGKSLDAPGKGSGLSEGGTGVGFSLIVIRSGEDFSDGKREGRGGSVIFEYGGGSWGWEEPVRAGGGWGWGSIIVESLDVDKIVVASNGGKVDWLRREGIIWLIIVDSIARGLSGSYVTVEIFYWRAGGLESGIKVKVLCIPLGSVNREGIPFKNNSGLLSSQGIAKTNIKGWGRFQGSKRRNSVSSTILGVSWARVWGKNVEIPVFDWAVSDVGKEVNYTVFTGLALVRNLRGYNRLVTIVGETQGWGRSGNTGFNVDVGLSVNNRWSSL